MEFAGVNYLAVAIAAVAGFFTGGVWYGVFGQQWMQAAGLREEDIKKGPATPYIVAGLANLLIAWLLAGVIVHAGGGFSVKNGLMAGFFVWFGFVLTTISVNYSFQMRPFRLILVDAGHWLAVLLVIGLVLGGIGNW